MEKLYEKAINLARSGEIEAFLSLVSESPKLSAYRDEFGLNLLAELIAELDVEVVEKLIPFEPDLNFIDSEGMSLLDAVLAARDMNCKKKVKLLFDEGFDIEGFGYNGWRPLHHAVFRKQYGVIEWLIKIGANVNSTTKWDNEMTALMLAARRRDIIAIKLLLSFGANVKKKDKFARTAIQYGPILAWRTKSYLS